MDHIDRIIHALDRSNISRQALADKLGLGRGAVSARLTNKQSEFDSLKYLEATAELTGFRFEWLRTGKGPELQTGRPPYQNLEDPEEVANSYLIVDRDRDLKMLIVEHEKLKFENEVLRSALREIGAGRIEKTEKTKS